MTTNQDQNRVERMRQLWNSLGRESQYNFISHLQAGAEWDPVEFHVTGMRFVERMMERFCAYGIVEPSYSSILEIGCGVGRVLKPLACRFKYVFGVDISEQMLEHARAYCAGLPNLRLSLNNGNSLSEFNDDMFDCVVCSGVFQHITDIDVLLNYIREAIRVVRPQGLFLFQFQGHRTAKVGQGQIGARITAADLNRGLKDIHYRILEISAEQVNPAANIVIVLEKADGDERDFKTFPLSRRRWLSGVYDDVKTKTHISQLFGKPDPRITFYDE